MIESDHGFYLKMSSWVAHLRNFRQCWEILKITKADDPDYTLLKEFEESHAKAISILARSVKNRP